LIYIYIFFIIVVKIRTCPIFSTTM